MQALAAQRCSKEWPDGHLYGAHLPADPCDRLAAVTASLDRAGTADLRVPEFALMPM
jgi:hypothetical protein